MKDNGFEPPIIKDKYIDLKEVAEAKNISPRAVRLALQAGKYIAREVPTRGGKTFEILFSSLELSVQNVLKPRAEVLAYPTLPLVGFIPETAKTIALARIDLVKQWTVFRAKHHTFFEQKVGKKTFQTQPYADGKQTHVPKYKRDKLFIEMYNSGQFLKRIFKILGKTSRGSLQRWKQTHDEFYTWEALTPQYRYSSINNHKTILTDEMIELFLKVLLHPNQFNIGKSISLTIQMLKNKGVEQIPSIPTFRRYALRFKKYNYDKWVLMREGEKALKDKVEPYIERDISKLEVGDVLVADGHKLNFQVINPFTGKPTRATLVGFLDWKSGALVGYEIMLEENTQCIASALRRAILNLGVIPRIVYQDNGRAFRGKYFHDKQGEKMSRSLTGARGDFLAKASKNQRHCQSCDFEESGFNGVYQNLGIKPVFAKPYNARAKVIERFFLEFQEEFEKLLPSYIGTSIQAKPARLMRNEKVHRQNHKEFIPTIQQAITFIDYWLEYKHSKKCPNAKNKTIQEVLNDHSHYLKKDKAFEDDSKSVRPFSTAHTSPRKEGKQVLNSVQKQPSRDIFYSSSILSQRKAVKIDKKMLDAIDELMMKSELKTVQRNGIRFLKTNYYDDRLYGLKERVIIKYSLFDLTKVKVYSEKGEFLCEAKRVEQIHPMARHMGDIKDMEDFKQKIQKQQQLKRKTLKSVKKYLSNDELNFLETQIDCHPEINSGFDVVHDKGKMLKQVQHDTLACGVRLFLNDYEKYDWLIKNGCETQDERGWLEKYIRSEEYKEIYG